MFYLFIFKIVDFIAALVSWLPQVFLISCFIDSLCAHVVFERSTEGGWRNLSGISDGWDCSLEQVACKDKKKFPLTINNYLLKHNDVIIIYTIHMRELCRFLFYLKDR